MKHGLLLATLIVVLLGGCAAAAGASPHHGRAQKAIHTTDDTSSASAFASASSSPLIDDVPFGQPLATIGLFPSAAPAATSLPTGWQILHAPDAALGIAAAEDSVYALASTGVLYQLYLDVNTGPMPTRSFATNGTKSVKCFNATSCPKFQRVVSAPNVCPNGHPDVNGVVALTEDMLPYSCCNNECLLGVPTATAGTPMQANDLAFCPASSSSTPAAVIAATATGMYSIDLATGMRTLVTNASGVTHVACAELPSLGGRFLAWSTALQVFLKRPFTDPGFSQTQFHYWVPAHIDAAPTGLSFAAESDAKTGLLWITNAVAISTVDIVSLIINRIGLFDGLPLKNMTSIASSVIDGAVIVGSQYGAARYVPPAAQASMYDETPWRYYGTGLYLPTQTKGGNPDVNVTGVTALMPSPVSGKGDAFAHPWSFAVATTRGVSIVQFTHWSLKGKVDAVAKTMYPRHDRHGFVTDAKLKVFGQLSSWYGESTDNDGLWTAYATWMYCFQAQVTKDPAAFSNAARHFQALEFLNNVTEGGTSPPGFVARSALILGKEVHPPDGQWVNSTTFPGWQYKANTSSDEITAHIMAYTFYHDYGAANPAEQNTAAYLLDRVVGNLVKHKLCLLNAQTNKCTYWGRWGPAMLDNEDRADDQGINSLEMFAYLLSAYRITGKEEYADTLHTLIYEHRYDLHVKNNKVSVPSEITTIDDDLGMLSYFTIFHTAQMVADGKSKADPTRMASLMGVVTDAAFTGLQRCFGIVELERFAPWMLLQVFAHRVMKAAVPPALEDKVQSSIYWTMRSYAVNEINWPMHNSIRRDLFINPEYTAFHEKYISFRVPAMDSLIGNDHRWSATLYKMDGGTGMQAYEPTAYMLMYWMGRFLGVISDEKATIEAQ